MKYIDPEQYVGKRVDVLVNVKESLVAALVDQDDDVNQPVISKLKHSRPHNKLLVAYTGDLRRFLVPMAKEAQIVLKNLLI